MDSYDVHDLFLFMTYHSIYNTSNTTGTTSRTGTSHPCPAHGFQWGSCRSLFCIALFEP